MPIRFECESCSARIKVPDSTEGRKVKCPRCGSTQRVPGTKSADKAVAPDDEQVSPAPSKAPPPTASVSESAPPEDIEESDDAAEQEDRDELDDAPSAVDASELDDALKDETDESDDLYSDDNENDQADETNDGLDDDDALDDESPLQTSPALTSGASGISSALDDLVSLGAPPQDQDDEDAGGSVEPPSDAHGEASAESGDELDAIAANPPVEQVDEQRVDAPAEVGHVAPAAISLSSSGRQSGGIDAPRAKVTAGVPTSSSYREPPAPVRSATKPPKYRGMTIAGWLLRILAVGLAMSLVAYQIDDRQWNMLRLTLLMGGGALTAMFWGIGEIVLAARDIARNSHR
jgi:predicted Zn finger-like uncharacterized protein